MTRNSFCGHCNIYVYAQTQGLGASVKNPKNHYLILQKGHTKKRPGQPETARSSPGTARDRPVTGNNARRIGILFKSNLCRNYILTIGVSLERKIT